MEMSIGGRIKFYRQKLRLSQQDLADKIGMSRQTISKWEQDFSLPDIEMLLKMADVFQIPLTELIGVQAETNSVSELYDQIKNVQNHLERQNKIKSILQLVLIIICVIGVGLMYSMKRQLDEHYTNDTKKESYVIGNVVANHFNVNETTNDYTYIEKLEMKHSNTDFMNLTTHVHYELSLKEFTANTEVDIVFYENTQQMENTYTLEKVKDNLFVLDQEIPLGNYHQVNVIIKDDGNFKTENIISKFECAYLDNEILNHIDLSFPKDVYGNLDLYKLNYDVSFAQDDEELPFKGRFIIRFYSDTTTVYSTDLTQDELINISEQLQFNKPTYISIEYFVYKENTLVAKNTIGIYHNSPTENPTYSYFIIEDIYETGKIF